MVFASDDLMDALVGNAEDAGEFGLRISCIEARFNDAIALLSAQTRIRGYGKGV